MELGQKLKQARLEAGLSQRQLCEGVITRNMLSQIENGSAKPSLATLQALSARLKKPVSYFGEDAPSENLAVLYRAMQADTAEAMEILQGYLPDDPTLDPWYYLLSAQCCMDLAEEALSDGRTALAQNLLRQAQECGTKAWNFENLYGQRLTILQYRTGSADAVTAAKKLPDNTLEMLLRATAALAQQNTDLCLACLASADRQTDEIMLLRADTQMQMRAYAEAAKCYHQLEQTMGHTVYPRLEICYRELGNFQKAYEYACKQR